MVMVGRIGHLLDELTARYVSGQRPSDADHRACRSSGAAPRSAAMMIAKIAGAARTRTPTSFARRFYDAKDAEGRPRGGGRAQS